MTLFDRYSNLRKKAEGNYYPTRTVCQIGYALILSETNENKYNEEIEKIVEFIEKGIVENGVITDHAAKEAEKKLAFMSPLAKASKVILAAHAHMDMNWMWGYQETVGATLDTCRTMLDLMDEYPEFTFSQSQASIYKIIEENDPEMLEEIKKRVHEGRWEITASTWVEADKNMPNGESHARHILYTKRYLSRLFDIDPDSLQVDFEPDTFGHNWSVPEILNKGGVKYYYHCRAYDDEYLYKWQSRSGASVLAYRDPEQYSAWINYEMLFTYPKYFKRYGVDVMLRVYGVGDHGGGPTRRDVEIISDMMAWPVMPVIKFGTYHEFFGLLEKQSDQLPVVKQEQNFVFTGCYTSQSRIKMANRIAEDRLYMSETCNSVASVIKGKSNTDSYAGAWENVLFNQFHDILPGSGVIDTREYAMGIFQKSLAVANTKAFNALRAISGHIDTSSIEFEYEKESMSEGGGTGFKLEQSAGYRFPQTERGNGKVRVFHVFNPTEFDREGPVELSVFDWNYDIKRICVKDINGEPVEWNMTAEPFDYWRHCVFSFVVNVKVPAFGYSTYILTEEPSICVNDYGSQFSGLDHIADDDIVLENDKVKAIFDYETMQLVSFIDKASGKESVTKDRPSAFFRFILEDDMNDMTSWRVGNYTKVENLNKECMVTVREKTLHGIRKRVGYEMKFKNSSLYANIILDDNSSTLKFNIRADWHEVGKRREGTPQLNFFFPLANEFDKYRYDIPFATIDREGKNFDMPGNSYAAALPKNGDCKPVMVVTDSKYGFRTVNNSIAVTLIRSSYDPDPYPEYGIHTINIGLAIAESSCNKEFAKIRSELVHTLPFISGKKHEGKLPLSEKFFKLSGDVLVSAIKTAEDSKDGRTVILRLYDANGNGASADLEFIRNISKVYIVDLNENKQKELIVSSNMVKIDVPAFEVVSVAVEL